jgi:hypothetical protein
MWAGPTGPRTHSIATGSAAARLSVTTRAHQSYKLTWRFRTLTDPLDAPQTRTLTNHLSRCPPSTPLSRPFGVIVVTFANDIVEQQVPVYQSSLHLDNSCRDAREIDRNRKATFTRSRRVALTCQSHLQDLTSARHSSMYTLRRKAWILTVVATRAVYPFSSKAVNRSAGVSQPSVLRGRVLSCSATAARSLELCCDRSVPFGKYCRRSPFVFSLVPRCHGAPGSQKYTCMSVAIRKPWCSDISAP